MIKWMSLAAIFVVMNGCAGEVDIVGYDDPIYFAGDDGELHPALPEVVIAVDASRSGVVDFNDLDDLEHRYDPESGFGALFLANIDDDGGACTGLSSDEDFESCFDGFSGEVVNDVDLADMARIKTMPIASVHSDSFGVLHVDDASLENVRIYVNTDGENSADSFVPYVLGEDKIDAEMIADGVEFAIEGTALISDDWNGRVELKWDVFVSDRDRTISDQAHIELAPVLFRHHMQGAHTVYASDLGHWNVDFISDLEAATTAAGVPGGLELLNVFDPWTQDFMLTGYMAMPGPDGPQVITTYFRSANLNYPGSLEKTFEAYYQLTGEPQQPLLREAGQVVFTDFHGSGTAGRAKYDSDRGFDSFDETGLDHEDVIRYLYGQQSDHVYPEAAEHYDRVMGADTLDSFGNTEVVPPHTAPDGQTYPHGRVFRGRGPNSTSNFRPDPTLSEMIEAQGHQPIIWLDTSWLMVAHVDETISFVETDTERGWTMLYNDPVLGKELLEEVRDDMGGGELLMFEDRYYPSGGGGQGTPAQRTVSEVLDDEDIMQATARAAVEIESQLDILRQEVGIEDHEMAPIGFLHENSGRGSLAYQPGMVNGISLQPDIFGAPKPHGPRIDGVDIVEQTMENELNALGIEVHWIENWDVYHVGIGEVHCASNVIRQLPSTPWWIKEI